MTTTRSTPLVPRWAVVIATFVVLGFMGLAIVRGNSIALVVLSLLLFFILGADVAAIVRAWRGLPPMADEAPDEPKRKKR